MSTLTTDVANRWRMCTAVRVFALAASLGFAVSGGVVMETAPNLAVLCGLVAVMSLPLPYTSLRAVAPVAEGVAAALIIVLAGSEAAPLLIYLVAPPLVAGLVAGRPYAVATTLGECVAVIAVPLLKGSAAAAADVILAAAPWLVLGVGAALLGALVRERTPTRTRDQAGYESAHRLLAQLRAVSRRLSAGLDTTSLAQHTLSRCVGDLGAEQAVLLVRSEGRSLVPLASHRNAMLVDAPEDDLAVAECWATESPSQRKMHGVSASASNRVALPLRVGTRMIGVVVADTESLVPAGVIDGLRGFLTEQSLKLESAVIFEEIRTIATLEERNRLAREIHDGVAQEVASLGYLVDEIAMHTTEEGQDVVRDLRRELSRVVSDLRLSIFDLRTRVSPHGGLGLALSDYAREMGGHAGMTVHLALAERPERLRPDIETELLRIAQEAITNARKHSRANNLWVTLNTESPVALLRVEDDGIGSPEFRADHYGLQIMHERAERIGADLAITTRPRGGTSVVVAIAPTRLPTTGGQRADHSSAR